MAGLLSRRSFVGMIIFVGTMTQMYVGWGTYFSLGQQQYGLVRTGCFDWLLGTLPIDQEQQFSFPRAWARDFVGKQHPCYRLFPMCQCCSPVVALLSCNAALHLDVSCFNLCHFVLMDRS